MAYAIWDDGPITCGEVGFVGATVFERLKDAKAKTRDLVSSGLLRADYIAIESAIMVKSVAVAIDLAYVYGAIIGELMEQNLQVHKVAPISWQTGIGNPNLTKAEKEQIKLYYPGKSASWYQNKGRDIRKRRTFEIMNKHYDLLGHTNNVSDAAGLAYYTSKELVR